MRKLSSDSERQRYYTIRGFLKNGDSLNIKQQNDIDNVQLNLKLAQEKLIDAIHHQYGGAKVLRLFSETHQSATLGVLNYVSDPLTKASNLPEQLETSARQSASVIGDCKRSQEDSLADQISKDERACN